MIIFYTVISDSATFVKKLHNSLKEVSKGSVKIFSFILLNGFTYIQHFDFHAFCSELYYYR